MEQFGGDGFASMSVALGSAQLSRSGSGPATVRNAPASGSLPMAIVTRGALALLSTQPITWAATLLTTLLLPRFLGDQGLGQYSVAFNLAGILGTLLSLGIPNYLVRNIASAPATAVEEGPAALVIVLSASLLGSLVLLVAQPYLRLPLEPSSFLMLAALAGMGVTLALRVLSALLNGQQRHARFAWINAAGVLFGALAGSAALFGGGDAAAFMAATSAATLVVVVFAWRGSDFHLDRAALNPRLWLHVLRGGAPFFGWNIALQIRNQIDVILVAALLSQHAAGWLSAAYRIVFLPMFLPTIITMPLAPVLSQAAHTGDLASFRHTLRRSLLSVLVLTAPASAMIMALAPHVPALLRWGESFVPSVPLITILAIDQPLGAIDMVLGTALFSLRKERGWLVVAILGATFNPVMNLAAIPLFESHTQNGAIGAACVEVATEILMMAGAVLLLPRGFLGVETVWAGVRVLLAASCAYWVVAYLGAASLPLALVCGPVAYMALLVALRVATFSDLASVSAVARQALRRQST